MKNAELNQLLTEIATLREEVAALKQHQSQTSPSIATTATRRQLLKRMGQTAIAGLGAITVGSMLSPTADAKLEAGKLAYVGAVATPPGITYINSIGSGKYGLLGLSGNVSTVDLNTMTVDDSFNAALIGFGSGSSAIVGESTSANAVVGKTTSGRGIYGISVDTNAYAGYFDGKVQVNGAFTATTKSFKIDHPLDPENKYLYHTCIESDEMLNVYTGNAQLDTNGEATVALPNWLEAINKDFRYQLTALNGASPELHIAQTVKGGSFKIAGGKPGASVSWQLTGIRNDLWAAKNRTKVEESKPAEEVGHYIHPELYGVDASKSVSRAGLEKK